MLFILASRNAHKLGEYRAILAPHEVEPMSDAIELPPEGTTSFAANARAKAEALARAFAASSPDRSGVVIADDSGIEVAALDGAPGVISARYGGREGDDAANNARLLAELAGLPAGAARAARFVCVMAWVVLDRSGAEACPASGPMTAEFVRGEWTGTIALEPRGSGGFGYDPMFVPDGRDVAVAEMTERDKNRESHRARAARALLARLAEVAAS